MAEIASLSNNPIQIAILQIAFTNDIVFDPNQKDLIYSGLKNWLPIEAHNSNRNINLDTLDEKTSTVKVGKPVIDTLIFQTQDKARNLSISKTHFTLTINANYSNWDNHSSEFKSYWDIYNKIFLKNQGKVDRISTRYINRIEIPDMRNPSDYFNTTIYAEDKVIPGEVNSFLLKYITRIDSETEIHVIQGFEPAIANIHPYLFDIDVICLKQFDYENIWEKFSQLRELKNNTFFSNLTDNTIKLLL